MAHPPPVPLALAKSGYAWVEARPAPDPSQPPSWFLTDGHPIGAAGSTSSNTSRWSPFRGCSGCLPIPSPAREGIKAFADRFGPLGRTVEKPIPLDDQRNAKGVPLGMGESLATGTMRS